MIDNEIKPSVDGRAWVEVDLSALAHNASEIRAHLPLGCELMAVVKTDAYGHGMENCAKRLYGEGVHFFAVATVVEGIRLRKAIPDCGILIVGYTHPKDAQFLNEYSLSQIVVDGEHASLLNEMGYKLCVHIAVDSGMHRLGIRPQNLSEIEGVFECKNLTVEGVATHFSSSDSLERDSMEFTNSQANHYFSVIDALRDRGHDVGKLHAQASYGIFNLPDLRCDYARAGIALYGVLSSDNEVLKKPALRPVLSLRAVVAQVRWIGAGESVSYGRVFKAPKPTKVATVCIGYADGVPRQMSGNGGTCLVRGRRVPIIGRICMDMLMLDVTDVGGVKAGDVATLIGRDGDEVVRCEDVAAASGTITNDILCRLGERLARIYKG
ncbi:MAG: serine racemase VanT catalytic subunit [Oscillospiraceae bacterium]|nr:serine racemase VanT catalytic subunit [Oscillospiraceae bacterium]